MGATRDTLAGALPREIARVRDEVLPAYDAIGPPGRMAALLIRRDLDLAAKAMAAGDLPEMIKVFERLKGTTT